MSYSGEGNLIEGEIEGSPTREVRPIVCDADGHLVIDIDSSTITIGTVDQGAPNLPVNAWPVEVENFPPSQAVTGAFFQSVQTIDGEVEITNDVGNPIPVAIVGTSYSSTAVVTSISVTTSPTILLASNPLRKGFIVQNQDTPTFVKLDSTVSLALYSYELPRSGVLEKDNYTGPVTAITTLGSTTVMVTELV